MLTLIKRFISEYSGLFLGLVVVGIIVDITLLDLYSDVIPVTVVILWVFTIWNYRYKWSTSIYISMVFVLLCSFFSIPQVGLKVEKVEVWAYMFLVVGVCQKIVGYLWEGFNDEGGKSL